jgi:hypothetical protein
MSRWVSSNTKCQRRAGKEDESHEHCSSSAKRYTRKIIKEKREKAR